MQMKEKLKAFWGNIVYALKLTNQISPMAAWLELFIVFAEALSPVLASVLMKYLLDELGGRQRIEYLIVYAAALVLSGVGLAMLQRGAETKKASMEMLIEYQFDLQLYQKAASMDYSFTESKEIQEKREQAGQGIKRMGGFLAFIREAGSIVSAVITLFTITAIFFGIHLVVPVMIIAVRVFTIYISQQKEKKSYEFDKENDRLNWIISYTYFLTHDDRAARDSRIYDLIPLYRKKMGSFQEASYQMHLKDSMTDYFCTTVLALLKHGCLMAAYLIFVLQAVRDPSVFTIGSLSMAISLTKQFDERLKDMIDGCLHIAYNGKYIEQYRRFLEMPDCMVRDGIAPMPERREPYAFEFVNVSFRYPGRDEDTLKNISCKICAGQKTALVGENGSGKSTMVKLLCRLYDPSEGRILLNGRDIREYSYEAYQKAISVVFQDYDIVPFSVRENVSITTEPDRADAFVWNALTAVGMKDRVEQLPDKDRTYVLSRFQEDGIDFSGGEKQKLAIARALYKNAPVMILDEPTAALDPRSECEIFHLFRRNAQDKTAVLISHRLSSCRICDQILVFKDGCLVQTGAHDVLAESEGLYRDLWETQAKHYREEMG